MPYQDLDSPEKSNAGGGNEPTTTDFRDEFVVWSISPPYQKNLSSTLNPSTVSRSRVIGSPEGLSPTPGETPSQFLARQRAATGNNNLQFSNTDDIDRQLNGNELVWDGNNFVEQTSPTLDPRGVHQIPPVETVEKQDQPTEKSVTTASNIGYAPGQIDPGLAAAAGIKPVTAAVGYNAGQVDPALAAAAGLVTSPGLSTPASGSSFGSATSPGAATPPAGTASSTSFNDRYDFLTKQKVREGKHGGQGGGPGSSQPCGTGGMSAPMSGGAGGFGGTGSTGGTGGTGSTGGNGSTTRPGDQIVSYNEFGDPITQAQAEANVGIDAFGGSTGYTAQDARNVESLRSYNQEIGGGPAQAQLTPGERAYAQSRGYTGPSGSNPKPLPRSNSTGPF